MPRTIIISFLGHLPYELANYYYEDINQYCSSRYFLLAVHKFFSDTPIDMTYVVLTEEARKAHWDGDNQENLRHQLLEIEKPFEEIDIPSIQSTEGLWTMFSAIEQKILEGDQIIFDITNSWRSQPVVALLIISFVKITKQAKIKTLIYGSFDRASNSRNESQPAYNLNSMATLLDWTTAVSTFQQTGRVENLAALTTDLGGKPAEKFAKQLEAFSQELLAARPVGTAWAASKLPALLEQVKDDSRPESTPLGLLLDSISETYQKFSVTNIQPTNLPDAYEQIKNKTLDQDQEFLDMQLKMIDWYLKKEMPVQAMTLAREWLVTLVAYKKGENFFGKAERKRAEIVLNEQHPKTDTFVREQTVWQQINIYNQDEPIRKTNKARNDLAHCGMEADDAYSIEAILIETQRICSQLRGLLSS